VSRPARFKNDFFIPLSGEFYNLIEDGTITLNMWCVYMIVLRQCDFETGIWRGTAYKIHAALGGQMHLRTVQNTFKALCDAGYLRSFHVRNERGNYPVLIDRYPVRFGKHKGYRVNAAATVDPNAPVYQRDTAARPRKHRESTANEPRNDRESPSESNRESTAKGPRVQDSHLPYYPDYPVVPVGQDCKDEADDKDTTNTNALAPLRATVVGNAVAAAPLHPLPVKTEKRQWEKGSERLIAALREIYERNTLRRFATTKAHEQAVLELVARPTVILAAFEQWCISSPPEMFTAQVKDDAADEARTEDIAWPLYNFVSHGHAERHIRAVEPYADLLPCHPETLRLLIEMGGELTGPQIGAVHDLIAAHGYAIVSIAAATAGSIQALLQRPRLIEGAKQTHYLFCIANRLDDTVDELGPDVKAAALDLAGAVGWRQALEIIDSSGHDWRNLFHSDFTRFCRAQMATAAQVA
jgi:hypothetical protein